MLALARVVPLLLFILGFPNQTSAQQWGRLVGTVRDAGTGRPLPSANIRVLESTLGTISNSEGGYRLVLEPGLYRIAFGYMGYDSDTLRVAFRSGTVQMDISLWPAVLEPTDPVVRPGAGDPAEDIVREAIARKKAMLADLSSYRFDAYTRTKISVPRSEEGPEWREIITLLETQTRGYWKSPDNYLEAIVARRQSSTFSATQNIFTAGRLPNFIRDRVVIGSHNVPAPLATSAFDYYSFSIIDTTMSMSMKVYRIHVEPKTQALPLFTGTIAIAEGSFLLVSVDLNGNEGMNSRPLRDWRLQQQFAAYEDKYWLPIDSRMRFTVDIGIQKPAYMDVHSILYGYGVNEDLPPGLFGRYELHIDPVADIADSTVWEGLQRLPLTDEESASFERIEREWERLTPVGRFAVGVLTSRLGQSNSPITESSDFFHFNRVEGLYVGAGLAFRESLPLTDVTVKGGYGFADRQGKYALEAERILCRSPQMSFGMGLERALVYREGLRVYTPNRISRLTLLYNVDPVDYYMRRGWAAWCRLRPWSTLDMKFTYQNKLHSSEQKNTDYSILFPRKRYRDNSPIMDGRLRCIVMTLDLDTHKYLRTGETDLKVEGENAWRILGELELTEGPSWKSDFKYWRGELLMERHQYTFGSGYLDIALRGGFTTGEPPPQRLFDLYGGAGGAYQRGVFMSLDAGEFVGDIYTLLWAEHNFGTMPLRAIGIRPRDQLDIDIILHGCVGACGLEGANADSLVNYGARATDGIHWEIGLGLARLLTFLRLDFTWRLTHLGGHNLVISIGTAFRL